MIKLESKQENLSFTCSRRWENGHRDEWSGTITALKSYANYIEFLINSRSTLYVICGKGERGFWICVPDYMVGCNLSSWLSDTFYNTEKLLAATKNEVDAITIAEALKILSSKVIFKN